MKLDIGVALAKIVHVRQVFTLEVCDPDVRTFLSIASTGWCLLQLYSKSPLHWLVVAGEYRGDTAEEVLLHCAFQVAFPKT